MAPMVKLRTVPTATRAAPVRGDRFLARRISASRIRRNATSAAIREHEVQYPGAVAPVPAAQRRRDLEERIAAVKAAKPFSDFLTDTFKRQHDYLRISITERCNLRCLYCMPEEGIPLSPPAHMLTTPEIFYLSSLFVSQGVTKIRLTGGEPTVRRDIVPLMQQIGSLRPSGLRELALTTNGISLHRKLDAMVEAGLTGINLSLDTLDPFQFQIMTRRNGFEAVMKSINKILEMNKLGAGVKLKVNCVVMRGLNEREIIPFVEMGREQDIEVRFIEYMPFGGNKWSQGKMISFQEMLDIIRVKYPGLIRVPGHKNDTSKTFEVPGFVGKVGFITSMTNDFCGTCNRLRITSDGNLKVCLHGNAEVSLRDVLRQGNNGEPIDQEAFERIKQIEMDRHSGRLSEETVLGWGQRERELLDVIGTAVKRKAEKHADMGDLENMTNRPMILIDDIRRSRPTHYSPSSSSPWQSPLQVPLHLWKAPTGQFSQLRCLSTKSARQHEAQPKQDALSIIRRPRKVESPSHGAWRYRSSKLKPFRTERWKLEGKHHQLREQEERKWPPWPKIYGTSDGNPLSQDRHGTQNSHQVAQRSKAKSDKLEDVLDEAVERHQVAKGQICESDMVRKPNFHDNWSTRTFQPGRSPAASSLLRYHEVYRPVEDAASLAHWRGSDEARDLEIRSAQNVAVAGPDTTSSLEPASKRPSEALRVRIPDSGLYRVDDGLTINFEADTHFLARYIQQMQDRLRTQHPRLDELPYEVWSTKNRKTLQTWLRVLLMRWKTRNQIHHNQQYTDEANRLVKNVLDQLVRDHDLGNEAADRMAQRFVGFHKKRSEANPTVVLPEGVDDREPGMSFLNDEEDELEQIIKHEPSTTSTTTTAPDRPQYGKVTKRLYSTSSRPFDTENPTSQESTENGPKAKVSIPHSSEAPKLPHLTSTGSAHMVSVSAKSHTVRTAIAVGTVYFSNEIPLSLIQSNSMKKGDVLSVSRIAGITAAKKCPDLVPLCHPILLTHVGVELRTFEPDMPSDATATSSQDNMSFGGVQIEARVECTGPTGVEMEALTSVMGTALSIVDMCKAVDKFQRIGDVRVVLKEGGKSGTWREEGWISWQE